MSEKPAKRRIFAKSVESSKRNLVWKRWLKDGKREDEYVSLVTPFQPSTYNKEA